MGFAEERVFEHILSNLGTFSHIHVTSLAQSLSCLTEADRDELQARVEARGTQAAVFKFYQFLKCRRGWVSDLIGALHRNNAGHLAEELQRVYDRHRPRERRPEPPPGPGGASTSSSMAGSFLPAAGGAPGPSAWEPEAAAAPTDERPCQDAPVLPCERSWAPGTAASAPGTATSAPGTGASAPGTASEPSTASHSSTASESSTTLDSSAASISSTASDSIPALDARVPVQESQPQLLEQPKEPERPKEAPEPGWPGRQQHPVCVAGGYFGSARLPSGGSAPAPRRNEPEEVHFVSAELPASGGPLRIQQRLQAEQEQPGTPREQEGNGAPRGARGGARVDPAPPVSIPAVTSKSSSSSEAPAAKAEAPVGPEAGGAPSLPPWREVHPASTDTFPARPAGTTDTELSKPGVLLSMTGPDGHPAFPAPSAPYSGDSNRLEISSDPLMMSTDDSLAPAPRADPQEEQGTGARSHPPPDFDSTSLRTHELQVEHCPSVPLEAPPEGDAPLGDPLASSGSSRSQGRTPPGDVSSSSYVAPAVGVALLSALAFLVYSRLQK